MPLAQQFDAVVLAINILDNPNEQLQLFFVCIGITYLKSNTGPKDYSLAIRYA